MVKFTDRPDMTLDFYRGRKTTTKQQRKETTFWTTVYLFAHSSGGSVALIARRPIHGSEVCFSDLSDKTLNKEPSPFELYDAGTLS